MKPTEEHIIEIAELLDCGQLCFFHKPTGTIEHHPNPDSEHFDPELWQETMDKIKSDWENYLRFEDMDSSQSFQIMENFTNGIDDDKFRARLFELLSQRNPFAKFKWAIANSKYHQSWLDFKKQANIKWVRTQLALKEG